MADLFEHAEARVDEPAATTGPASKAVPLKTPANSNEADMTSQATTSPKAAKSGSYSAKDIEVL
ncbi:MAG: hypothetical protein HQ483_07170, partial [Rhodospirillales bacterium]|nr:hypothetical protein [Rhodospirillales bacterium]